MDAPKRDLQPYKNQLMGLSYEEKIQMSEWLHAQIDIERAEYVKQKGKQVTEQLGSFIDKASQVTKTAGNSLLDSFKQISGNDNNGVK